MALILHFYQYAEIYSIAFVWCAIPCAHLALFLWIKNNSVEEPVKLIPQMNEVANPSSATEEQVNEKVAA